MSRVNGQPACHDEYEMRRFDCGEFKFIGGQVGRMNGARRLMPSRQISGRCFPAPPSLKWSSTGSSMPSTLCKLVLDVQRKTSPLACAWGTTRALRNGRDVSETFRSRRTWSCKFRLVCQLKKYELGESVKKSHQNPRANEKIPSIPQAS